MKKILLGLFLMLGAISFTAPSHIDTNKAKQNGYESLMNSKHLYSISKQINNDSSLNIVYSTGVLLDDESIRSYSESLKEEQEEDGFEYISSGESEAGYVHKLYSKSVESFYYIVVGKSSKVKGYVIVGTLQTPEEYSSKADLKKTISFVITEGDKYLK